MPLESMKALSQVPTRQWSSKQLRRLGECLRERRETPAGHPSYEDVVGWFDDLAAAVSSDIRALDWCFLLSDGANPSITSRAKTIDTLRDKLCRDPATPLPSIQDTAGVRFECEMTLEDQDIVAATVARAFDCGPEAIRDLRDGSHAGYRGVHVWLRLPQGRAEVQVRTHLQGEWANTYEALADWLGRRIRYGDLPKDPALADVVKDLQGLSTAIGAPLEKALSELATSAARLRQLEDAYTQRLRALHETFDAAHRRGDKSWPLF